MEEKKNSKDSVIEKTRECEPIFTTWSHTFLKQGARLSIETKGNAGCNRDFKRESMEYLPLAFLGSY